MAAFTTNLRLETYGFELSKCMLGAFILRSSACTINDIFDRKVDAGVGEY
jgi:4-hydroxybenzoate polyprenyltransferase